MTDEYGKNGLHYATEFGHTHLLKFLVKHGIPVNALDKINRTPLHYASMIGEWVHELINLGANLHMLDSLDRTPWTLAAMHGQLDIVKLFLSKDSQLVHHKDQFKRTILHYAMFAPGDTIDLVQVIIKYGGKINEVDEEGKTPIYYACYYDKETVVIYLLSLKANIPGMTTLKYNKLFLRQNFPEFHQPRVNLDPPDKEIIEETEKALEDISRNLQDAVSKQMLDTISKRGDGEWRELYLNQRLSSSIKGVPDLDTFLERRSVPEELK